MSARLLAIANDQDALSERFDHFEMKLLRRLTSAEAHAQAISIMAALGELPARDRFVLTIEISGDALTISNPLEVKKASEHITSYHEGDEPIEFRIEIWKEVAQQRLSMYSPTAFASYLDNAPLADVLAALSKRFQDRLIFECYSGSVGLGSATLCFVNRGDAVPELPAPLPWRSRSLALLQDNAYRISNTGTLMPQDFAVTEAIGITALDTFMARAGSVIAAMFISNMSDLRENELDYRITGYKLLSGTVSNVADLVDGAATFQRIADWAYGPEGNSDKVGLARNVISLCVQRLEEVPAHPEIWDAIQSNYQIYLKENIATYLEVRNKLAELLAESTHKAQSLVEGLLDSIRNGVLIVLTFLLTVVVVNGLKDTGVRVIFSTEYLAIVLGLLVLSSLAIWGSCRDARSRFDQSATATSELLQRMYSQVMIATEIEEHVNPTIAGNRSFLERQARKYLNFWLILAVLVALAFLAGHYVFIQASGSSNLAVNGPTGSSRPAGGYDPRRRIGNASAPHSQSPGSLRGASPTKPSQKNLPQARATAPLSNPRSAVTQLPEGTH